MKNRLLFVFMLMFAFQAARSQCSGGVAIPFNKTIDSISYRSKTLWLAPTPFCFTTQFYSLDSGKTTLRAGFFGGTLYPYVKYNPAAARELRGFRIARILGMVQMLIIAPYFLKRQIDWTNDYNAKYSPPYPDIQSPPYMAGFFGFLYGGAITYHFISKPYFRRALREYHRTQALTGVKN